MYELLSHACLDPVTLVSSDVFGYCESTMTNVCFLIYRHYTPLYLKHINLCIAIGPMISDANGDAAY